ncbi:MAG: hypothetical protein FJY20_11000 [Bacteroidetes bacterium]|nr:hypothetical protein [Bacteroidota bacterium]
MKKIFIGLLIAAAGAGVYFFLLKKKKDKPEAGNVNKELIIGKWKSESYEPVKDSAQSTLLYEFQKDGIAYRSLNDTAKADTLHYSWKESAELFLKKNAADSSGISLKVNKLTADSLQVLGSDSISILFTRMK